jgi:hypothetical protein
MHGDSLVYRVCSLSIFRAPEVAFSSLARVTADVLAIPDRGGSCVLSRFQ